MSSVITSPEEFTNFLKELPEGTGIVRLTHRDTGHVSEFSFFEGSLAEFREEEESPVRELTELFHTNGLLKELPTVELKSYAKLWNTLNSYLPSELQFRKERYREVLKNFILKKLSAFDWSNEYLAQFQPEGEVKELELLPALSISELEKEIFSKGDNPVYQIFPDETNFIVAREAMPKLSFEGLITLRLIKRHSKFQMIRENTIFSSRKTENALRELLRSSAILREHGESSEEFGIDLNVESDLEKEEAPKYLNKRREALLSSKTGNLKLKRGVVKTKQAPQSSADEPHVPLAKVRSGKIEARSAKKLIQGLRAATDEGMLHAVSYVLLVLLLSVPWFFWGEMFRAFGP